ncbi:hypothetical protein SAY86_025060 [Trapa natans]|uniref:Uncharacterized protein n=1 Tax=Trapa natans TaxID=22666 RepID=A0AAN7M5K0_TRANT|nr:hypothetical protein SAY86_025060 [Trapa natans]
MCSVTCSVYFAPLVCHSLSLSTAMGRRSRWCSYGFRINSHGFLSGNSDDLRSVIDVGSLCVQCTGSKTRDDLKVLKSLSCKSEEDGVEGIMEIIFHFSETNVEFGV